MGRHREQSATAAASGIVMSWPLQLLAAISGIFSAWLWSTRSQPDDWAALWIAGMLFRRGQQDHLYDHHPEDFSVLHGPAWLEAAADVSAPFPHPYVHNPLVAAALSPFSETIDFDTSFVLLLFFSGAAIVVTVAASFYLWFGRTMPWGWAALATGVVLALPMTSTSFWLGQTTPLIVAGVCYGLAASRSRPWAAGIVLAVVAIVKLTPYVLFVVLAFFAWRRRALWWALGSTAVLYALMFVLVDTAVVGQWWQRLGDINEGVVISGANQSLTYWYLAADYPLKYHAELVTDFPAQAVALPRLGAFITAVVAAAVAWWHQQYRFEILTVSALLVATAFSTIVWNHYALVVVPVLLGLVAIAHSAPRLQWSLLGAALVVSLLSPPLTPPTGAHQFAPGLGFSGLIAMLTGLAFLLAAATVAGFSARTQSTGEPMVLFDVGERLLFRPGSATVSDRSL